MMTAATREVDREARYEDQRLRRREQTGWSGSRMYGTRRLTSEDGVKVAKYTLSLHMSEIVS